LGKKGIEILFALPNGYGFSFIRPISSLAMPATGNIDSRDHMKRSVKYERANMVKMLNGRKAKSYLILGKN
jgi:hypothetical protein